MAKTKDKQNALRTNTAYLHQTIYEIELWLHERSEENKTTTTAKSKLLWRSDDGKKMQQVQCANENYHRN